MSESAPAFDPSNLLLIVAGAHLRAEEGDRPLAYRIKDSAEAWLERERRDHRLETAVRPLVCSDVWYMNHEPLQQRPTISVGGPGVNALTAFYAQRIHPLHLREEDMIIQLDPEFVDLRVCAWGMDHARTSGSVELFIQRYLDPYLRAVVTQVEPQES